MLGWIKLHRCTLNKAVWQNQNLWRIFCWCLMKATHKETELMVGMNKVILQPGQFIFGRRKASEETGVKEGTVVDCMKWLQKNETIGIKPTTKYSVITVINWALYQSDDVEKQQQANNNATTTQQQANTNKNDKNIKNDKKNIPASGYDYFSDFWKEYPRQIAKIPAQKAFAKLKVDDALMEKIMDSLYRAIESEQWKKDGGQYVPYPATWLNQRRWEDGH